MIPSLLTRSIDGKGHKDGSMLVQVLAKLFEGHTNSLLTMLAKIKTVVISGWIIYNSSRPGR